MRLLLDEMYTRAIADQLRQRDHDVSAVTERPELRSLPDGELFAVAQRERRTVVTENIADFSALADGADQASQTHYGLVLVDPAKYPRGQRRTVGRVATELARFLRAHPGDAATSLRHCL